MGIKNMRKEIDKLDRELVKIIAKRHKLVRKIKSYKNKNKIKFRDIKREKEIIRLAMKDAKRFGADKELAVKAVKILIGR